MDANEVLESLQELYGDLEEGGVLYNTLAPAWRERYAAALECAIEAVEAYAENI